MNNYAECLAHQVGVKQNIDLAAEYFYKAMKAGYFKAKKNLDKIFMFTKQFKVNHPEYKVVKNMDYWLFEGQTVDF